IEHQGDGQLGSSCVSDAQCDTNICRRADKDGDKCQQTDTRVQGDACLCDAACL
ncbi:1267_t:CDS:1, partial [Racocetra fulgida]